MVLSGRVSIERFLADFGCIFCGFVSATIGNSMGKKIPQFINIVLNKNTNLFIILDEKAMEHVINMAKATCIICDIVDDKVCTQFNSFPYRIYINISSSYRFSLYLFH